MARTSTYHNFTESSLLNKIKHWSWSERITLAYALTILTAICLFYICSLLEILPHHPDDLDLEQVLVPPLSNDYFLGTDNLGRDILTRLMLGTQAYFIPGLMAVLIAIIGGGILGASTTFTTKSSKKFINLFNNSIQSMPRLVILFLFIAIFEPEIYLIMLIIGISHIPSVAKVVNNRITVLKEKSFIDSALASGLALHTILIKHILWFNCRAILIAQASLIMSEAILMEVSLSYLGFGVQEPTPSWGNMIQSGANYLMQGQFWSSTIPAIAVMLILSALFLLSNLVINKLDRT